MSQKSGAQKRKETAASKNRENDFMAKVPKLTTLFSNTRVAKNQPDEPLPCSSTSASCAATATSDCVSPAAVAAANGEFFISNVTMWPRGLVA